MTASGLNEISDACIDKLRSQLSELKNDHPRFPHSATGGKWKTSGDAEWKQLVNGYWTGGFWVGLLFLAHRISGDPEFLEWAHRWLDILRPRAAEKGIHDLGFLFYPSCVLGCDLLGDDTLAEPALAAAANVAARYSPACRCLTIFARPPLDRTIAIDTMMNLPLLWWAAGRTGNEMWRRVAANHVDTTAELLVRANGSTVHVITLQAGDHDIAEIQSWQGRAPDSCWTRGQAWAISGAAYAWLYTRDSRYRDMLDHTLSYFESHLPEDLIPYWDLDVDPSPAEPRDASALAIAAHALMLTAEPEYVDRARRWLSALAAHCLAPPDRPGLIEHVCFHRPAGEDVDCACVFADFYFFAALASDPGLLGPVYKF